MMGWPRSTDIFPEPTPWNGGPDEYPPESDLGEPEDDDEPEPQDPDENMPFSGSSERNDLIECDCCGALVPKDEIHHVMPGPHSNAPCETFACDKCTSFSGSSE